MPETSVCIPAACRTTGQQLNLSSGGQEHRPCKLRGSEEKTPASHTIRTNQGYYYDSHFPPSWGFPGGSNGKELPAVQETRVPSLGREDALEKGVTTHAGVLAAESKGPGGARPLPRQPSEAVPWGQAGPPGPAAPSPSSTSPSRLQVASRCSSSCRPRAQSLVTLRISSRRAWLAELAWSSCSLSSAFTWARLALLGGAEESRWVPGRRAAGPRAPPAGPPLLLLLQADEGALQVLAVPCVLRGMEAGASDWAGQEGSALPPRRPPAAAAAPALCISPAAAAPSPSSSSCTGESGGGRRAGQPRCLGLGEERCAGAGRRPDLGLQPLHQLRLPLLALLVSLQLAPVGGLLLLQLPPQLHALQGQPPGLLGCRLPGLPPHSLLQLRGRAPGESCASPEGRLRPL